MFDEFYFIGEPSLNRPKENKNSKQPLKYLGQIESGFLMVINSVPDIDPKDLEMVQNLLLNGLKLTWENAALLNLNLNPEYDLAEILTTLKPRQLLVWGCNKHGDSVEIADLYSVKKSANGKQLWVDEIAVFHDNNELKRKLWNQIKLLLDKP